MFGHQDEHTSQRVDTNSHYLSQPAPPPVDEDVAPGLFDQPLPDVASAHATEPDSEPVQQSTPEPAPAAPAQDEPVVSGSDDLQSIKHLALKQLTPLVDQLDQTPEERFRTTMMMIQAADNQSLLKVAYEAASQIGDEKVKAQALLDVINEINYFTQQ